MTSPVYGPGTTPAPAAGPGVTLITADALTTTLVIRTSGIWDGGGKTYKRIDCQADDVTIQNFYTRGGTNNGIYIIGNRVTVQSCDIAQVVSDGDVNGITFFGDDIHILKNNIGGTAGASDYLVKGNPGSAHTDGVQTWNTPTKRASKRFRMIGNRIVGPLPPNVAYVHQGLMAEGEDTNDGGGGGTGRSEDWLIKQNVFITGGNQVCKVDDIHNVIFDGNTFAGNATRIIEVGDVSTGIVYYDNNVVTGTYPSGIGVPVTPTPVTPPTTPPTTVDPVTGDVEPTWIERGLLVPMGAVPTDAHELTSFQWELDGLVMGPGTDYNVSSFEIGSPDITANDTQNPRGDGERHGREFRSGRTITFELNALALDIGVLNSLADLEARWDAEEQRERPGAYSLLRYNAGNRTRRVWGSPREFATVTDIDYRGNVPVTASFRTVDHRFYADAERTNTISIAPSPSGGLVPPISEPVTTLGYVQQPGVIRIGGNVRTWLYFIIYGPITNPTISCLGEWDFTINTTVPVGQYVSIDSRPWSRGIRLNGSTPIGGALAQSSPRLTEMRLPPGFHEIILNGQDVSQTASLLIAWRDAFSSY